MPARSRWRQRRGLRRSCTLRTRQRQPPQRGMLVVGSTSQTRPVSVNSTALTTVNLIPSTVLSRVVVRMVVGAPKVGLGTPEVPLRPCAFHNHSFSPTSYQPIPGEFRHPATRSRPRGFHQTYQRAKFQRLEPAVRRRQGLGDSDRSRASALPRLYRRGARKRPAPYRHHTLGIDGALVLPYSVPLLLLQRLSSGRRDPGARCLSGRRLRAGRCPRSVLEGW